MHQQRRPHLQDIACLLQNNVIKVDSVKLAMLQEYYGIEAETDEQADGDGPAESHMSESDCMGGMHRCASLCVLHRYCLCILANS